MEEETDQESHEASAEFIRLMTGNQRKLYAFIMSLVRNGVDADDILQETNLVLWRKNGDFQPGTNFDAWSFRIAQYQVMAFRKKRQRLGKREYFDNELLERLADEATLELQGEDHRQKALLQCLRKLKEDQRRMIAERYEPGASVQDLAAEQGRSPKALSEALRRIRKTLMLCIETRMARGMTS